MEKFKDLLEGISGSHKLEIDILVSYINSLDMVNDVKVKGLNLIIDTTLSPKKYKRGDSKKDIVSFLINNSIRDNLLFIDYNKITYKLKDPKSLYKDQDYYSISPDKSYDVIIKSHISNILGSEKTDKLNKIIDKKVKNLSKYKVQDLIKFVYGTVYYDRVEKDYIDVNHIRDGQTKLKHITGDENEFRNQLKNKIVDYINKNYKITDISSEYGVTGGYGARSGIGILKD